MFSARFLRSISNIERPGEARRFLRLDRYWCAEVAEPLLKRIDELVSLKPHPALELAQIAVELVQRIRDASPLLQANAYCSLGVAQRFTGKLREAETSFRMAERLAEKRSALLLARIARHRGLLLADLRQFEAALEMVRSAVAIERREGVLPSHSLVCEAVILVFAGQYQLAAERCQEVLDNEDPASAIYTSAMNNLAGALANRPLTGPEIVEARKLLRRVQDRIRGIRSTPVRYTVWYSEGLLHAMLEEFRLAIDHLQSARAGFLRLNLLVSYANASIDLAAVYVKKQDDDAAKLVISRTLQKLTEAGADEQTIERFRVAERVGSAGGAVELLRSA